MGPIGGIGLNSNRPRLGGAACVLWLNVQSRHVNLWREGATNDNGVTKTHVGDDGKGKLAGKRAGMAGLPNVGCNLPTLPALAGPALAEPGNQSLRTSTAST